MGDYKTQRTYGIGGPGGMEAPTLADLARFAEFAAANELKADCRSEEFEKEEEF